MNSKSEFNWEGLWRNSGNNFVILTIIAYIVYGYQPQAGSSTDTLINFYQSHHMRILIATVISGLAVLNLMWFASTLRSTLVDYGRDGWGAAAIASSSTVAGLFILLITVGAAITYSIASTGNSTFVSNLNDFEWASI